MSSYSEQALLLGPRKSIIGIVSVPDPSPSRPGRPAVIILNSGILHRVGANRMSVVLGRKLATSGFTVVRFDLSGIGDSRPRDDGLPPLDAALLDIREVLDSVETVRGTKRFILVGLCSGADHSIIYGGSDPRVVGFVLMDPTIPRTPSYYAYHYLRQAGRLESWANFLCGRHPLWTKLTSLLRPFARRNDDSGQSVETAAPTDPNHPTVRQFLEAAYKSSMARSNRMLAIFTGGVEAQHSYRRQLVDAFPSVPFGDRLTLEYMPDSDHLFTDTAHRSQVIAKISRWIVNSPDDDGHGA